MRVTQLVKLLGAFCVSTEAASVGAPSETATITGARTIVIESPFKTENLTILPAVENRVELNTTSSAPQVQASCEPANAIIKTYVKLANTLLGATDLLTGQNLSLFGLPDNHLDPLKFNDQLRVNASDKICAPQKCITILGADICTPDLCVGGQAEAVLEDLIGLSTLKAESATCTSAQYLPGQERINATGVLKLNVDSLTGNYHADASGSVLGINIPVSTTGNFTVVDAEPSMKVDVQLSYREEANGQRYYTLEDVKFTDVDVLFDRVKLDVDAFDAHLDQAFSSIVNPFAKLLIEGLNGDGVIAKPLTNLLNGVVKNAIPEVNKFLGNLSF